MQYNIKWLSFKDIPAIMELSKLIYSNEKDTYPVNLKPADNYNEFTNIINIFLVPDTYLGSDQRSVLGVFDEENMLIMAIGVRKLLVTPTWLLSWAISNIKTAQFIKIWRDSLNFICDTMELHGINEFFVVSPAEKEKVYEKLMRFLRDRYWTFTEIKIPRGRKTEYNVYWAIMGYQLYSYDINIRRYILKREHDA